MARNMLPLLSLPSSHYGGQGHRGAGIVPCHHILLFFRVEYLHRLRIGIPASLAHDHRLGSRCGRHGSLSSYTMDGSRMKRKDGCSRRDAKSAVQEDGKITESRRDQLKMSPYFDAHAVAFSDVTTSLPEQ
ncbi:hypothetical protein V5799_032071 [Amblyomma americanum]|uniref:Uncharacterized protein n=1 Tax=Amblyomma americanum TaxID=6943 RepID=A0AAQ4DS80_AMBAM